MGEGAGSKDKMIAVEVVGVDVEAVMGSDDGFYVG